MTHMTRTLTAAFLLGLALVSTGNADEKIYKSALKSTVWILTPKASGTGFVVDLDKKLVATNYHVIRDYYNVAVIFPEIKDGEIEASRSFYKKNVKKLAIKARVVTSDPRRDLAILRLEKLPKNVTALKLAAKNASPGQQVHSIGNPSASDALWIYTSGTVRQVYKKNMKMRTGFTVSAKVVETQSPINPGDSGGPVVNKDGEVVAVSQSFRAGTRLVSSCIAVSELKELLNGSNKTMDPLVQKIVDDLKLQYTLSILGNVRVMQKLKNGKIKSIFISNSRRKVGNLEVRDIYTTAYIYPQSVPQDVSNMLLEQSGRSTIAAWSIRSVNKKKYIVYSAKIAANADSQSVKQLLETMAASADSMATRIKKMDDDRKKTADDPAHSVVGSWIVKARALGATPATIHLELNADRSFAYRIGQTVNLKGRFSLVGERLTLTIGGSTLLAGKVSWSTRNEFLLNSKPVSYTFSKQSSRKTLARNGR
ncbi:MAG: serine protease [Planctomycetaceae bacterium]